MPREHLPPEVRDFIARYLHSLEQLEVLLLLFTESNSEWTVQTAYERILSSKPSVERWLEDFARLGFFAKSEASPPAYRFAAKGELAAAVENLAVSYRIKPVRVIEAIFKKDRDPAQGFADAFKIRKEP